MGAIVAGFSMSLDGFIARPNDDVQEVFKWMSQGDTEFELSSGNTDFSLQLSAEGVELFEERNRETGAIVSGRRMFDVASAWGGKHPLDVPIFVLTHDPPPEWLNRDSPFTFVTDGMESAVAQAKRAAGDKNIGVGGADVTRQCLRAGLLDEIQIDLVPILLGDGIRLFDHLDQPIELERIRVIEAPGVTHLTFRVVK